MKNGFKVRKVSALLLAFLLCFGMLAGCGKDTDGNEADVTPGADKVTATVTPEAATATPTPTPTVIAFKQSCETAGREDLYRIPIDELKNGRALMETICRGNFILMRFAAEGAYDAEGATFVLLDPCASIEPSRVNVDYDVTAAKLLPNGTVVVAEQGNGRVHVFDNTLRETANFAPDGTTMIGVSDDGLVWNNDAAGSKLIATDLQGQPACEYSYDPKYQVARYLGSSGDRKTFVVTEGDDWFAYDYMHILSGSKDVSFQNEYDTDLGDDWKNDKYAPTQGMVSVKSDSTWFFHAAGRLREGYAFPKQQPQEQMNFLQDKMMCSINYRKDGNTSTSEFLLYDMDKQTVSGKLSSSDIPDSSYADTNGVVGDGNVVIISSRKSGGNEMLLWASADTAAPIEGFFDFSKDEPAECLAKLLKQAEESGIVFTPDRTEDDGTPASLGEFMAEMELINTFLLCAKENPDVLKNASGNTIHPENKNCNDGAHFTFNRHVFSTFYLKEHGEELRDGFYAYVDALCAGEDRFRCEDVRMANWSSGKFAEMFFPIAKVYADAEYTDDGWATITYKIPKEEFLKKEREFEEMITGILNDVLEDDYSDIEKTLALYEFLTEYAVYDYDMAEHNEERTDEQTSYRVLMEHQGICGEIAQLYQYLALQCGVDMDESVGAPVQPGEDMHAWDYVKIGGVGYLVDATWGMTDNRAPALGYFLFTDERRENRDGYSIESFDIGFYGLYGARKKYSFEANDTRYKDLWDGLYVAFDEDANCIYYKDYNGNLKRFEYGE